MTKKTPKKSDELNEIHGDVFEQHSTLDKDDADIDAQDRNLLHTGKTRSNKKMKAFFALGVVVVVALLVMVVTFSQVFKKGDTEKREATVAEKEQYARNENRANLDEMKKNIPMGLDEMKATVVDETPPPSPEAENPPEVTPPPFVLPVEPQEPDSQDGEKPLTPAQRRLQGNALLDDKQIAEVNEAPQGKTQFEKDLEKARAKENGDFLQGTHFTDGSAEIIKNRRYLLSAATSMSCVLKTKIITSYPAVIMCQITKDVYSDDGKTVLVRAGAMLQGEQTQVMTQGVARVFANWTTIKDGNIRVRVDALGADSLGASGLPAWIDSHFWDRFKGAILLSLIQDSIKAGASQITKQNNSDISLDNTTGSTEEMAKLALENSINIPPTAYINQGEMLTVIVPRNIDFSSVYEVK